MQKVLTPQNMSWDKVARMDNHLPKIHAGKTPVRRHFIPEWAEKRDISQSEIGREIGADKSLVSRWFSGTKPGEEYLQKLAALLVHQDKDATDPDVAALFRDPNDDWLMKFFKDRSEAEKEKAIEMLKLMFRDSA